MKLPLIEAVFILACKFEILNAKHQAVVTMFNC